VGVLWSSSARKRDDGLRAGTNGLLITDAGTGLLNYAMLAVIATFKGQCDVVRDTPWQVRRPRTRLAPPA
jgi:hypothetical protein